MLSMIAKLLKVLNSEADPSQISIALGFSMITGFLPLFTPLNLVVLLVVLVLRVNISAYLLGSAFFAGNDGGKFIAGVGAVDVVPPLLGCGF